MRGGRKKTISPTKKGRRPSQNTTKEGGQEKPVKSGHGDRKTGPTGNVTTRGIIKGSCSGKVRPPVGKKRTLGGWFLGLEKRTPLCRRGKWGAQ